MPHHVLHVQDSRIKLRLAHIRSVSGVSYLWISVDMKGVAQKPVEKQFIVIIIIAFSNILPTLAS